MNAAAFALKCRGIMQNAAVFPGESDAVAMACVSAGDGRCGWQLHVERWKDCGPFRTPL